MTLRNVSNTGTLTFGVRVSGQISTSQSLSALWKEFWTFFLPCSLFCSTNNIYHDVYNDVRDQHENLLGVFLKNLESSNSRPQLHEGANRLVKNVSCTLLCLAT